ncbi:unnamed protein product [Phytophthora lilii]|uniref:Unnamed protein product n=1 Tax=Phytophthora lilii TaxID=2077276 RepID=A0A9W6TGF0_9STRA|nr:unnamed protein product [Phytophthora lilii]
MTTNASEEKDGVVETYQSMVPSPVAELDTTPASDATSVEIASKDQSREGAVHRALREYRLLEFGCAIVVYLLAFLFSVIEVHQRPIPGIKVRLNSTTVIWSLDPSLSEPKLSEHGTTDASAFALAAALRLMLYVVLLSLQFRCGR